MPHQNSANQSRRPNDVSFLSLSLSLSFFFKLQMLSSSKPTKRKEREKEITKKDEEEGKAWSKTHHLLLSAFSSFSFRYYQSSEMSRETGTTTETAIHETTGMKMKETRSTSEEMIEMVADARVPSGKTRPCSTPCVNFSSETIVGEELAALLHIPLTKKTSFLK
jgi:hypothetical protein